jgi:hypothetical protein
VLLRPLEAHTGGGYKRSPLAGPVCAWCGDPLAADAVLADCAVCRATGAT